MNRPLFLHCPKTGGTSLAKAFGFKRVGSSLHSPLRGARVQRFVRLNDPKIVAFLRDPADRLKSLFRFIRDREDYYVGRTKATQPCVPLTVCRAMIKGFGCDINDFYHSLLEDDEVFQLATLGMVHLRPQAYFVTGCYSERVEFFDFHDFDEEVKRLAEYLEVPEPVEMPWIYKRKFAVQPDEIEADVMELIRMRYAGDYSLIQSKFGK